MLADCLHASEPRTRSRALLITRSNPFSHWACLQNASDLLGGAGGFACGFNPLLIGACLRTRLTSKVSEHTKREFQSPSRGACPLPQPLAISAQSHQVIATPRLTAIGRYPVAGRESADPSRYLHTPLSPISKRVRPAVTFDPGAQHSVNSGSPRPLPSPTQSRPPTISKSPNRSGSPTRYAKWAGRKASGLLSITGSPLPATNSNSPKSREVLSNDTNLSLPQP